MQLAYSTTAVLYFSLFCHILQCTIWEPNFKWRGAVISDGGGAIDRLVVVSYYLYVDKNTPITVRFIISWEIYSYTPLDPFNCWISHTVLG